jgi:superfamily II DNA or RNA helicase
MNASDYTAPLVPFTQTPEGLSLMPHQQEAVERALRNRQYLIAHEQGTGKTITGIMLAQSLVQNGIRPVLVSCPPSLRVNWANEFAKWAPHLTVAQLKTKRPTEDAEHPYAGLPDADVLLVTDGTLAGFHNWYIGGVRPWTWDDTTKPKFDEDGNVVPYQFFDRDFGMGVGALIVDECQRIASTRGTARTGAWLTIGQARSTMPKFLLSGTPFSKSRVNLKQLVAGFTTVAERHTVITTNKDGEVTGTRQCVDAQDWLDTFAPTIKGQYGKRAQAHTERLHDEMFDAVRGWAHRVRTADVITDLPDLGRITVAGELEGEFARAYKRAETDLASWLLSFYGSSKAESMMRAEALIRVQELRRLVGRAKVQAVIEQVSLLLDVPEGEDREQVLVMCTHSFVREELLKHFGKSHKVGTIHGGQTAEQKQAVVEAWQDGEVDVLVANVMAGSVGFTMTAGRHIVFAELPWNSADLVQSEARLQRKGQTRTVVSTAMLGTKADGGRTIDHDLWGALQSKFGEAEGVLDGNHNADLTDEEVVSVAVATLKAFAQRLGIG